MGLYETTFIVNPQTDDATIDRHVKEVIDIIDESGGKVVHQNRMGTRRMAYAINGLTQGYYANFIFEAPKTVVPQLNRHMRLGEAYLRHLTVVFEGAIPDKDAPPSTEDFRYRPRGGRSDRPFGRREGARGPSRAETAKPSKETPAPAATPAETAPVTSPATTIPVTAPVTPPTATPAETAPVTPPAATIPETAPVTPPAATIPETAPVTPPATEVPTATEAAPQAPAVKPEPPTPAPPAEPPASEPAATEGKSADDEVYREEEEL